MSLPLLPLTSARVLHLAAQQLQYTAKKSAKSEDLLACIQAMGLLQIDTISVVARSPYLVLFSRLGQYPSTWLDAALANGQLFEYWAHEACFIPTEQYPLFRHRMLDPTNMGWKYSQSWVDTYQQDLNQLLAFIEQNGPVRSADFKAPARQGSGWWNWKPHKKHLEMLFTAGELMVRERKNFQRVYDLRQRILPHWNDEIDGLPEQDAQTIMLQHSARALGIFKAEWLADYYRLKGVKSKAILTRWLDAGEVMEVNVAGIGGSMYLHNSLYSMLENAQQGKLTSNVTTLLSPFDPVVWDRRRALSLFDFDYRLECYTPEAKRQYGYFTLPILQRGELIGRTDAKMHRKQGVLEIKSLYLQPNIAIGARQVKDITDAITRFARWHNAKQITIGNVPASLATHWGTGWLLAD